jgi:hypothetical protein
MFDSYLKGLARLALAALLMGSASAQANINDNFDRADSATVGNSWVEKTAAAFAISGNRATKAAVGTGYRDNIVYRPSGENVADVEASVELRITGGSPGYPQVLTRVQTDTVGITGLLDGYILYVSDSFTNVVLGRQSGANFVTTLANITTSPAMNTTDTYRLRLRTTGTTPVAVTGWVERLNGATWDVIGTATVNDNDGARFTAAGSVGFSGYVESNYSFDNFVRTNLNGASNPTPATTGLSPTSATQGENGLTLTVSGSNFVNNAVVRWNGADRATTFVSSTLLEAAVSTADLSTSGTRSVTVFNPAPGGGTSNAQTFTIDPQVISNPVPTVGTLSPNTANQGGAGFTLTVNGTNFASSALVRWNGSNRATTFVSPTQLTATIAASDIATAGNVTVTVFNPAPGGGTSNNSTFSIVVPNNPAPVATSLAPSSGTAGGASFTLTVNGSSFVNGSTVRWNASNRATTFVSANQLTATINASDIASAGSASVTVTSPAPGGGTSGALTFTIQAGGGGTTPPTLTSLSIVSANSGSANTNVTITGTGFTAGSVGRWNGSNRTTTFLSSTQIRVTLTSADLANETLGALSATNSGGSGSNPLPFYVIASGNVAFVDNFNRANSATIGNGWTEKNPSAFALTNGEITSTDTTPIDFHDNIVYRTASSEDLLNVEVSEEFRRINGTVRFPQLHARVQRGTLGFEDTLESYILYFEDNLPSPGGLAIAVQPAITNQPECIMAVIPLPQALDNTSRYRLRFRVQGSYPVQLTGYIERYDGNAWQVMNSGTMTHDNNTPRNSDPYCPYQTVPAPITTAGTVGFAKYFQVTDNFDNYAYRSLTAGAGGNIPNVQTIAPSSATAGGSAFTLTVNGSNFSSGVSTVRWNGANRTTTFVSATQLQAAITAADIATAGSQSVTVFNSGTGGGLSPQSVAFSVTPPAGGGGGASFSDDFARADSDSLGNGWIEKLTTPWFLQGGRAVKQGVGSSYQDNVAYRPASEDVLDVEASAVMRITGANPGYPQIFTRIQSGTAAASGFLQGYILYIDGVNNRAVLGRQEGYSFLTELATLTLSPALNTTDTFRLRLSTVGTTSVQLQAYVERLGTSGWSTIGTASVTDSSANRIQTAGAVGFSGYTESGYSFDDFTRSNLP